MSGIDDLLRELAPDGVQVRPLASLGKRNKGTPITAARMKVLAQTPGGIRIFAGGQTVADVSEDALPSGDIVRVPSIIVKSRGHIGFAYYDQPFTHKSELWSYSVTDPHVEQKFVYYYLLTRVRQLQEVARATSVKLPQLSVRDTDTLPIPVPPLEVQREIVRILDQFTQLEAELEAELEARREQYRHYRDSLLTPSSTTVKWLTLREVARDFGRGKSKHRPRNDPKLYGGQYPFIQTGDIRSSGHRITEHSQTYSEAGVRQSKVWPRGTICITIAANIAETGVLDFDACFPDSVIGLVVDPAKASSGYVEYLLQSLRAQLVAKGQGSAQANINLATFESVRFPFPDLDEQERIANALDKFDALVTDLSVGLPAELAARRKQYEYYRDQLLAFHEVA